MLSWYELDHPLINQDNEKLWDILKPRLNMPNKKIFIISTPNVNEGTHYET